MNDWIKSEDCTECDGEGYIKFISHQTEEYVEHEKDQCQECERLVEIERRADIYEDISKGN